MKNTKTGHPAIDQHIPIFMEVYLRGWGVEIRVYDLTDEGNLAGIWFINWKGVLRTLWTTLQRKPFTVFAGMSLDDLKATIETGDRPLGYDG